MTMLRILRPLLAAALLGGCSSSDQLIRPPAAVAFVGVTPGAFVLTIGDSRQMTAILRDADGNRLIDRSVVWSVDDTTTARITMTGQLTGVGHGYVTITATSEGKSSSVAATIVPPEVSTQ